MCEHGDGWTSFRRLGLNYALFDTQSRLGASGPHWVHTHRYNGTFVNYIAEPIAATLKRRTSCSHGLIVQELCESRGGRPELSVLTSLLVSVDVKLY